MALGPLLIGTLNFIKFRKKVKMLFSEIIFLKKQKRLWLLTCNCIVKFNNYALNTSDKKKYIATILV